MLPDARLGAGVGHDLGQSGAHSLRSGLLGRERIVGDGDGGGIEGMDHAASMPANRGGAGHLPDPAKPCVDGGTGVAS